MNIFANPRLTLVQQQLQQPRQRPQSPSRHLIRSTGIGLLCCALAAPAAAVDLMTLYETARDNDPVLGAAEAGHAAAKQAIPQARSALLPTLTAGANTNWNERGFPGAVDINPSSPRFGQSVPDQEFNEHTYQAQLRAPIVNMEGWYGLGSARASVRASAKNLEGTEQTLIVRVVAAYLNVLRAQDRLDSILAEEAAVKRQLEQVQQRFDVGLVAITDVLESQAVYDNAVVQRIQADGDHGIFFESLRTLTNANYDELNSLSARLPIVNPEPSSEEEWVATAMDNNLVIAVAQEQLAASRSTLRARRAGHLPTVDATASRSRFITGGANFFGADTTETTVYGLQITVPLYQGGLTSARAREARALADQSREILMEQRLNVSRDTRNLFRAVATDVVRVRARLKAIRSSESALEATETGYEVGTRNIVDVLQAQQRLFSSQFDYADSRYNYVLDLMGLKQASGMLVEADLEELNQFTDASKPVKRLPSLRNRSVDLPAN